MSSAAVRFAITSSAWSRERVASACRFLTDGVVLWACSAIDVASLRWWLGPAGCVLQSVGPLGRAPGMGRLSHNQCDHKAARAPYDCRRGQKQKTAPKRRPVVLAAVPVTLWHD